MGFLNMQEFVKVDYNESHFLHRTSVQKLTKADLYRLLMEIAPLTERSAKAGLLFAREVPPLRAFVKGMLALHRRGTSH